MTKRMSFKWFGILLIPTVLILSGCHTAHGIGKDIEASGQAMQHSAKHTH